MAGKKKRRRIDQTDQFLDSKLFRIGTKLFIGIVVVLTFLTLVQCTVKKPEAPEWTTNLTIPVISRTYDMAELIWRIDQNGLQLLDDTSLVLKINETIDTVRIDQTDLSVPDIDTTFVQTVGTVSVSPPNLSPVAVDLSSLVPVITTIPDTNITVDLTMPVIGSFRTASISSGTIDIVINNNLAIDIDSIVIVLYDVFNPLLPIAITSTYAPIMIPDGGLDSISIDLAGYTISNSLLTSLTFHTPGGSSLRAGTKNLSTAIHFNNPLKMNSATAAAVPSFTVGDTAQVQLGATGDPDVITSAQITSGILDFMISNNSSLNATVQIEIPDLFQNNQPLMISFPVTAFGNKNVNINLSGYEIIPSDQTAPQYLDIIFNAVTDSNKVDIDQTQNFSVHVQLSSLLFGSVSGVFSPTPVPIVSTTQKIDVPQGFDGLQFTNASLSLQIVNAAQIAGSLSLQITGNNGNVLNINGFVQPATPGSPVTSTITNNNIASFLYPIPDTISISGDAFFGDGVSSGTIRSTDFIFGSVEILSPLEMIINPTTIKLDVETTRIDTADIDAITNHVERLNFIYTIENSLPLGLTASVYLDQSSGLSAAQHDLAITGMTVPAAPTGGGLATGVSTNVDTIVLTNADIQVLYTDSLYILPELTLAGSGGQPIKLLPTDSIRINGRLEVEYLFNGDF